MFAPLRLSDSFHVDVANAIALEGVLGGDEFGTYDGRNPRAVREGRDDGHDGRP